MMVPARTNLIKYYISYAGVDSGTGLRGESQTLSKRPSMLKPITVNLTQDNAHAEST